MKKYISILFVTGMLLVIPVKLSADAFGSSQPARVSGPRFTQNYMGGYPIGIMCYHFMMMFCL